MNYSGQGLALTEKFEGDELTPYQDVAGVWTDGYGNTHNVQPGVPITETQSILDLRNNVSDAIAAVNSLVSVEVTQSEFDALVDFTFNEGSGRLAGSTLLRKLNAGDYQGAAAEFPKWDLCAGQVSPGLQARRAADQALFLQGVQNDSPTT
jgi:lysozyme